MTTYSEKLKNPKWQRKRLEILNRDNFTCCKCGDTETELHVHHLKYTGEPYEAPNEDLETLCKHCHEIVEIFTKNKNFKGDLSIVKINNMLLLYFLKGNFLFKIVDNELNLESLIDFEKNSPLLKLLYESNISNG